MRSASKKKYQHRKTVVTLDKFNPADAMGKHRRVEVAEVIEDYIEVGEARRIPMNQVVIEALKSQPRMLHNPFVLYGRDAGQPLKNGIKHSDWLKYLKIAVIENLHWHDLRHTFAGRLVASDESC